MGFPRLKAKKAASYVLLLLLSKYPARAYSLAVEHPKTEYISSAGPREAEKARFSL